MGCIPEIRVATFGSSRGCCAERRRLRLSCGVAQSAGATPSSAPHVCAEGGPRVGDGVGAEAGPLPSEAAAPALPCPCRSSRTRWRRIQRQGNRQARLALRRRQESRWHCRGCGVWWRLGSLTRVRRHGSCGVGSCIAPAIFVLLSGHFEPRCKEHLIICR